MDRSSVTVFVVDDDAAVLSSLETLFASVGLRVQTYDRAASLLAAPGLDGPGCLVLDIRLPDVSGLELQDALTARRIRLPVILITGNGDVPTAVRGMRSGALDLLEKPFSAQLLLERVEEALRRDDADRSRRRLGVDARARLARLTPRETEIVQMVTEGRANKEMAKRLGIALKTVELHRAKAMKKLGVSHVSQIVALELLARTDG